jgi:transposase
MLLKTLLNRVHPVKGFACRRLLWIGNERTSRTLLRFFRWFGEEKTSGLQFVCSDMWNGYVKVIAKNAAHAVSSLEYGKIAIYHALGNLPQPQLDHRFC